MLFDALLVKPCWFKIAGLFQCRHQICKFLCSSRITPKDWKIISRPLLQCCTGNSFSSENKSAKMVHNKQVRRKCQSKCILMCLYNKLQEKNKCSFESKNWTLRGLISSVLFVVYQQLCLSHSLCLQWFPLRLKFKFCWSITYFLWLVC